MSRFTIRDANTLKEKAVNMSVDSQHYTKVIIEYNKMLWSGTIHYFSKQIL